MKGVMIEDAENEKVSLVAAEVAQTFCDQFEFDEAVVAQHMEAAFIVGQTVADCGRPGDWAALDVDLLFSRIPREDARKTEGIALAVLGMVTWLALTGALPAEVVLRQLQAMRGYLGEMEVTLGHLECCQGFVASLRESPPALLLA